jgi:hypothetical protein
MTVRARHLLKIKPRERRTPMTQTTEQALEQQKMRAYYDKMKEMKPNGNAPAVATGGAVARPEDVQAIVNAYLDTVAPAGLVGREIQFKDGSYITRDDGKTISEETVFIAAVDQMLVGVIKFNGKGERPDVHMAAIYEGQLPPHRETLGDLDEALWPIGLSGKPEDPWQRQNYLPLLNGETGEWFTFVTRTVTGLKAVGILGRHYQRMHRTDPDMLPLVKLKVGGFPHREERIGWVTTPAFAVVGKHPKDNAQKPDASPSADMSDEIPC